MDRQADIDSKRPYDAHTGFAGESTISIDLVSAKAATGIIQPLVHRVQE